MSEIDVTTDAEIVLTRDQARALTDQICEGLENVRPLIVRAYQERAWAALDYPSWDAYMAAEFPRFRLDDDGDIALMREAGMSTRAIASATGLSQSTVSRKVRELPVGESNDSPVGTPDEPELAPVIGLDGKRHPAARKPKPPSPEPARIPADEKYADIPAPADVLQIDEWHYESTDPDNDDAIRFVVAKDWDGPQDYRVFVCGGQSSTGDTEWWTELDPPCRYARYTSTEIRELAKILSKAADELDRRNSAIESE